MIHFVQQLKNLLIRQMPASLTHRLKLYRYARVLRQPLEPHEPDLAIVKHLLGPRDSAIDIGANYGIYTTFMAGLVGPHGSVMSFEPIRETYQILAACVDRLQQAVSNQQGVVHMIVPPTPELAINYYQARVVATPRTDARTIASTTLDACTREMAPVAFIKCDVEGHELAVVEGAERLLQRDRPAWLIELAEDPDRPTSAARGVVDRLAEHGYRTFLHKERGRLVERSAREQSINYFFLQPHHVTRLKDHGVEVAERAG